MSVTVLGIDPGPREHTAAVVTHNAPAETAFGTVESVRTGGCDGIPIVWLVNEHGQAIGHWLHSRLVVLEFPECQGRLRNAWPVHKAAAVLLGRLLDAGCQVYTPPSRVIWGAIVGKATATDTEKLAWLRSQGHQTGKGTPFAHTRTHNVDAWLAARWGLQWQTADADARRHHLEPWLEPRS